MAKETAKGNCFLLNLKDIQMSDGVKDNRGINTFSPALLPVITFASSTYFLILLIINLVPLHKPYC